jgi:hypothetical protein
MVGPACHESVKQRIVAEKGSNGGGWGRGDRRAFHRMGAMKGCIAMAPEL